MRKDVRIRPGKGQSLIGFVGSLIFVGIGVTVVIPTLGTFGIFWTLIAIVSTVVHGVNTFSNKGIASAHFEIEQEEQTNASSSKRLQEAKVLYEQGLINKEEYEEKRKQILKDL